MKNQLISFGLCFFLSIVCFSQTDLNKQADSIVIAGKFKSFNADTASRFINFYFDNIFENEVNEVCQINNNGSFVHKTKRPFSRDYLFHYEDFGVSFFIAGGDSIFIEIDLEKKKAATLPSEYIIFSGSNKAFNNKINDYYKFINSERSDYEFEDSMRTHLSPLNYRAYIKKRDSIERVKILNYNNEKNTSKAFETWTANEVPYHGYYDLVDYGFMNPFKNKQNKDSFLLNIPEPYFSFLKNKNINNREALNNSMYHLFLMSYDSYIRELLPKDSSKLASELWKSKNYTAYHAIKQRNIIRSTSGLSQDLLLARFYHQLLTDGWLAVYDTLSKQRPIKEPLLNSWLKEKYIQDKLVLSLKADWEGIELNNGVNIMEENILDSILRKHKGKLVYLDFWGPWCAPCLNEMNYLKDLYPLIDTNKVSLVYLGVQCSKEYWKVAIARKKPIGDHYLLTDAQYKIFYEQFSIKTVPRFVLIGKNGEIIAANAPWPSETTKLTQLINTSLQTD